MAALYAKQDSSLTVAGSPIEPIPIGIAIRKHDPLRAATQKAIAALYANGTIRKIVARWGMAKAVEAAQVGGGPDDRVDRLEPDLGPDLSTRQHVLGRAWPTVYIAVLAQLLGILLGLLAALMRMSKLRPLRLLSGLYVWLFRGTPVLVQIVFVYYGSNILFGVNVIPNSVDFGLFTWTEP